MENKKNLEKIVEQIKEVDVGVNNLIVPMLKDTINDYKKTFNKMVTIIILLIVSIVGVFIYSQNLVAKQVDKYNDFLSQFEFVGDDYIQDLDATDGGNAIINDGINVQN